MPRKPPAPKTRKKSGPPSKYTVALGEHICAELSNGKPLRQICREIGIDWSTVHRWKPVYPKFAEQLQLARDLGEEAIAAECLEIADTPLEGVETTEKPTGTEIRRSDMLGHRKLQIDTRLKLLAKWNPTKWGDKIEQTINGPVNLVISGSDVHG